MAIIPCKLHVNQDAQIVIESEAVSLSTGDLSIGPTAISRADSLALAERVIAIRAAERSQEKEKP